jgi:hypothetical protein
MTSHVSRERVFYRNRLSNLLVWAVVTFGALYFLVKLIGTIKESHPSPILIGFTGLLMIAFLIPALRYPRHGVVSTDSKIIIRNIFKTHTLRWDDVERFELTRYDPWPKVGVVILQDGGRIPMTGVQFALATSFAQNTIDALNTSLAARRDGSS